MITTALTERLGIDVPILSAPMAGVSGGALASAVTQAGGLGFVGGGYGDLKWIERELEIAGDTRVGLGLVTWAIDRYVLDAVLEHEPGALFLSFGELEPYAQRIKRKGIPLIAQVQSVRQAIAAVSAGADFIVAQGTEAGGHCGTRATFPLVPAIKDAVGDVPVIAAGGIGDGRGLAASLMLGADGVLCGSVFYASEEALSHPKAKAHAVEASGDDTERRELFDILRGLQWPGMWQLRALRNALSSQLSDLRARRSAPLATSEYAAAAAHGDLGTAAVIVGEVADLIGAVRPAGEIVRRMVEEADQLLFVAPRYLISSAADRHQVGQHIETFEAHSKHEEPA